MYHVDGEVYTATVHIVLIKNKHYKQILNLFDTLYKNEVLLRDLPSEYKYQLYWLINSIRSYNKNENKVTLFNTIKLIWPIILSMIIFWLLILIIWYVAGLPLGIDTLVTM